MKRIMFFLLVLLSHPGFQARAQLSPLITHINSDQGLSNNGVTCILQDHYGFLWFGTWDGLNKWDGKKNTIYKPTSGYESGLSNNNISCLYEDKSGYLWIGTKSKGLNRMNLANGLIENLSDPQIGIEAAWINDIQSDKHGNIWISAEDGIYRLDSASRYSGEMVFKRILTHSFVSDIQPDNNGNLWFAAYDGLYFFSDKLNKLFSSTDIKDNLPISLTNLTSITIDQSGIFWISSWTEGLIKGTPLRNLNGNIQNANEVFNQYEFRKIDLNPYINPTEFKGAYKTFVDSRNSIWVVLWGKGLLRMNTNTGQVEVYRHSKKSASTISNNYVLSVFEDESGLIWVGTDDGGVNKINVNAKPFYTYTEGFGDDFGRIGPIAQTRDNTLFVGTRDAGLFYTSFRSNIFKGNPALDFKKIPVDRDKQDAISFREIIALFEDSHENLWIGTTVGLNLITKENRSDKSFKIRKYYSDPKNPRSLSDDNISHIMQDARGTIWVGTINNGLNRLDSVDNKQNLFFTRFLPTMGDSSSISHFRIRTIFSDRDGNLWVGTDCGLDRLVIDKKTGKYSFKTICRKKEPGSLSDNSIICINEDQHGNLWIGTTNGLNILSKEEKLKDNPTIKTLGMNDGLPSDFILSILFDDSNQAWITTNGGMVKINSSDNSINVFTQSDGFTGNVFSEESGFKNKDGYLFFGDINGLNIFNPQDIKQINYIPKVRLLAIYTDSPNLGVRLNPTEKNSLLNSESVKLKYNQRNFTLEFISLCFITPDKNQYQYMLEGFDKEWISSGTRNFASYTNIPPGKYTFRVKGSNGNGAWSPNEAKVDIRVKSPWWFSPFSFIAYAIIIFLLVYSLTRINMLQVKLKNRILIEKLEKEKIEEVNYAKLKFFTNISHEFRTPLTLILISLKKMMSKSGKDEEEDKSLNLIEKNVSILLRLVNQIMDLRKIENNMMVPRPGKYDLVRFVKQIYDALVPLSEEKHITYTFNSELANATVCFDYAMLEKVFWNILSNAFKYTYNDGEVKINLSLNTILTGKEEKQYIRVTIKDDGPGIPPGDLDKIFDRFYQAGLQNTATYRGTGIGLSIAKEMVELNKGFIHVRSSEDGGACFEINLPVKNPDFEKIASNINSLEGSVIEPDVYFADARFNPIQEKVEKTISPKDKPLLLIIEDNRDLRLMLRDSFSPSFKIETAADGKEGLEIAFETMPDIIVSDVAMPEMNGLKLCEKLKSDIKTSHIPIILLTAKTSVEHHLDGLNANADDYITKPFDLRVLEARINNLLRERKYLKEKYKNAPDIDTKQLELNPTDQRFIDKSVYIIEKNLSDYNFSIDDFAKEIGMSRSSLYRKIQAVTGQSAKEFIRDIRIKKAAKLLEDGERTVSEVAFDVGFISRSYFAKCFFEYYKMLPSKYAEEKKNIHPGGTKS